MHQTIESTRFGPLQIADEAVVEFPDGLIGLGGSRFTLLARDESNAFLWLHSLDDPSLAIPVTNPFGFFPYYEVELSDAEAARIGISDPAEADVYVTVRAGEELSEFSANLLAPILISRGRGWQVINETPDVAVRAPLFTEAASSPAEAA